MKLYKGAAQKINGSEKWLSARRPIVQKRDMSEKRQADTVDG